MRDLQARNIFDDLKPDTNQLLGNICPDYTVSSGERCKLLTNDPFWINENSNISEAALKQKREKAREHGYPSLGVTNHDAAMSS